MNLLRIDNCYSFLFTDNEKLKTILWQNLRFRERNYFHNVAYKMKRWDGFRSFLDKDTGKFLTGLLPEVQKALSIMGETYEVEDNRANFKFAIQNADENLLNQFLQPGVKPVELRDYQVDYINQVIRNKRGIVYAPTSAGKSLTMAGIVAVLPKNTPTLILANRKSLIEQNYDEIKQFGFDVGRFYGNCKEIRPIICATVQSAHGLKAFLPKVKCLIVDEIHDMMSKKPRAVYQLCKNAVIRVGLSATPFKFGEKDKVQKYEVKGYIGPVFKVKGTETGKLTTKELQKRKFLSTAECFIRPVKTKMLDFYTYMDAITEGIAQNEEFHQMNKRLVEKLDGRILILVERIAHGDRLSEIIPNAVWVRGQDDMATRKQIIKRLKEDKGKVVAIATVGIFNTGINVFAHHLVNSASGQAEHQIVQRFGRGLRVADDKKHLMYHDWMFYNNDYLLKHSEKRVSILRKEGHKVTVLEQSDL